MVAVRKYFLALLLLFSLLLSGCNILALGHKTGLPEKGVWYCEELEMEISFSNNRYSYANIDGNKVHLAIDFDYGGDAFCLCFVSGADYGHIFFACECDYWDEDKMLVTEWLDSKGHTKGKQYTFVRVK